MSSKKCVKCGKPLSSYNKTNQCFHHKREKREEKDIKDKRNWYMTSIRMKDGKDIF